MESDEPVLSDEEEERLTNDSPMKENCSNNILVILPTGIFVVAKIALYKTLKSLSPKLLMALVIFCRFSLIKHTSVLYVLFFFIIRVHRHLN